MKQKNLQKLLNKEMSRKEFLAHVGAGALIVTGFSGLFKSLLDYRPHNQRVTFGYGSSSYGGERRR